MSFFPIRFKKKLRCGNVLLELTQIGKKCHTHCEIYKEGRHVYHANGRHIYQGFKGRDDPKRSYNDRGKVKIGGKHCFQ